MAKTAHFIGLCGAGMAAVAYLLRQAGYIISGSDQDAYPPVSDYLDKHHLPCHRGFHADNIPLAPDLIVIGKNARLTEAGNPEVAAAFARYPDRIKSFPEMLAELTRHRDRIVVAGSYGKSTVASLISWCLTCADHDPGYFIGAIPKNLDTSSRLGRGSKFVFEGDEYPSANWDNRAKFLHYTPQTLILTSACHDHVNIYPTLAAYHAPFADLLEQLQNNSGILIACVTEQNAFSFYQKFSGRKLSYGIDQGDFHAADIALGMGAQFDLIHKGKRAGRLTTRLLGQHNIENIVAAAACLMGEDILDFTTFRAAIAGFEGLERRLDLKTQSSKLPIYEGFGSSYEKARAAIKAIRDHYPDRKITILFEPHTFTWRNRRALHHYDTAFEDTHRVMIYTPPSQGAASHDQLTLDEIVTRAAAYHPDVETFTQAGFRGFLTRLDPDRDILLILSSGGFEGHLPSFIEMLETAFPASGTSVKGGKSSGHIIRA